MPSRSSEDLPAMSPLRWLVLALVIEKPSYGYEISERYARRFGTFMPAARNAVYGALDRLEQVGLIAPQPLKPAAVRGLRGARLTYAPTSKAIPAHKQWLSSPSSADRWREELLARIGTAHLHSTTITLDLLDRYAQHAELHRQRIQELLAERSPTGQSSLQAVSPVLVLQEQQAATVAHIYWARTARQEIEKLADDGR